MAFEDFFAVGFEGKCPALARTRSSLEQNTVVIKGEAESESDDEEPARRYASRLDLPFNTYKFDEIKADLKNGVLRCSFVFPASMMGWCLVAGYVVGVLEALAKRCGATCSRYGGCRWL
ncbi:hypothetical protein RJ640_004169 [Escallonia rubra]|uniref:SHSP domain-containing protein n=1 Tax=Escallonia rubra TaxID=112253 RepID=A0AA88QM07_9ASTE|nr:hypothetical protein RJ640_004169 [Escallonia rubra]